MRNEKRFIAYMGNRKSMYFFILVVTLILLAVIQVLYSYTYKILFHAIEYRLWDEFVKACILCIIVLMFTYFSPYMRYFHMRQVRNIVFDIKIKMFTKLTNLNMQYFEENHSGDVLKRLNHDADCLKDTYFSRVFRVLALAFNGVVAITTMIIYSWKLAVVAVAFSILSVLISIYMNKIIDSLSREIVNKIVKLAERLSDVLAGFLIIKMYGGGHLVTDAYFDENNRIKLGMVKRTRVLSKLEMLTYLTGMLGNFGTILVGVFLVLQGEIDYGTVMAVITLQMGVSSMFQNMGSALANYTASLAEANRVFDFLELEDVVNATNNNEFIAPVMENGILVDQVTFAYKDRKNVLYKFNLEVEHGEKLMLVGGSGCGKSTLLKLLMRFYDKSDGKIHIYGHEINDYSVTQLHNMITYVPQGNYLFAGTIRENIMYGNPLADEETMKRAAELAYAKEFIDEYPDGFDTVLTLGGKNLSGGQRQRIAIARAFLKDVESEKKINLAMNTLMENKIVILVTHRTSSFGEFDRVVEM